MTEQEMREIIERYEQALQSGDVESLMQELQTPTKDALQSRIKRYRKKLGDKEDSSQGTSLTPEQTEALGWIINNIDAIQNVIHGGNIQTESNVQRFEGPHVRYNQWVCEKVRDRFKAFTEANPQHRAKDVFSSALNSWLASQGY